MYIEGKNAVKQAVESGHTINKIFVSQNEKGKGNTGFRYKLIVNQL